MAKTRISKRCSFLAGLIAAALAGCGGSAWDTAIEMPKGPRHPDGVALEPAPALPSPNDRAEARGVIALREPMADKDVEDVVRAYIRAFEREDEQALIQLLAQEAVPLGRPGTNKQQLVETWHTRLKSYEYQRLSGLEIARLAEIERGTYDSLGASGTRPPEMRPGDLWVKVPITTPRLGSEPLFGDYLILLLRREDGRLKIAGQADENAGS